MGRTDPDNETMKEAFAKALHEQRGLLHEVFAEVLEDFVLTEAVREGRQTDLVGRAAVFDVLEDNTVKTPSGVALSGISKRSATSLCCLG